MAGSPVSHAGPHYASTVLQLAATSLSGRVTPIWLGGDWLIPGVRRRMLRCDGCCLYKGTRASSPPRRVTAEDVREMRVTNPAEGFDICVGVRAAGTRSGARSDQLARRGGHHVVVRVGGACDADGARRAVARGPLRI